MVCFIINIQDIFVCHFHDLMPNGYSVAQLENIFGEEATI